MKPKFFVQSRSFLSDLEISARFSCIFLNISFMELPKSCAVTVQLEQQRVVFAQTVFSRQQLKAKFQLCLSTVLLACWGCAKLISQSFSSLSSVTTHMKMIFFFKDSIIYRVIDLTFSVGLTFLPISKCDGKIKIVFCIDK